MSVNVINNKGDFDQLFQNLDIVTNSSLEVSVIAKQIEFVCLSSKKDGEYTTWIIRDQSIESLNQFFGKLVNPVFIFDLKQTYKKTYPLGLILPIQSLDLMIASYVENSSVPGDLGSQAKLNLNQDLGALRVPNVSNDIFGDQMDTKSRGQLAKRMEVMLQLGSDYLDHLPPQLRSLWLDIENPIAVILAKMELGGVHLDRNKLQEVSTELINKAQVLETQIKQTLESPDVNLNSPQQLGVALTKIGFDLSKSTTKGGKVSVDKEVLDSLAVKDTTGIINQISEYRTLTKLSSTYTVNFLAQLDSTSRLHGEYDQVKVATGRLSSSNPNLQNIPIRNPEYGPLIRSCFTAKEGYVLVGADYSQFELRILAHFSGDPKLIEAFGLNQDIHARTASEIFVVPIEEVTKEQRRVGKTLNFALVYQQGVFATANQLGIDQKEAKTFIETYFVTFARVKPFVEEVLTFAKANNYVVTYLGRRRFFQNLDSPTVIIRKAEERAAFNAVLQGSNADLIKKAMIRIDHEIASNGLDAHLVLQVHDELVLEVRADQAEQVRQIVVAAMEDGQPLQVPIVVDSGIGANWRECR